MLSRIDNKYVLNLEQFKSLLKCIGADYSILEIDDLRKFSYSSCYYDEDLGCYFEHHQGRRQRMKVRTRAYLDSGSKFFEIKLKGLRGMTNKFRTDCDSLVMPGIRGGFLEMLNSTYQQQYKKVMPFRLTPSLIVNYYRCTLVSQKSAERITIDFGLNFSDPEAIGSAVQISNEFIIVETKSSNGKGITDCAMKKLNIRKAKKCSKYCIGVNLTGKVKKNNNFLHMIKRIRRNIISPDHSAPINGRPRRQATTHLAMVKS